MTTALLRLTWKEYRANRAFWVGLVVLAGLVQLALATLVSSADTRTSLIFMFALGAPAFFAVGSAGTTFAMEREERTLEFLRAIPARARQVFVSKLAVAGIATVAMYLALWPTAVYFNGGRLPDGDLLRSMLGLWLVAALEALAWGTFFSLLTDRPILAICEAIFVVSLGVNLLVPHHSGAFWRPTGSAVLVRMAIAIVVLAIDVGLNRHWFHRDRSVGLRQRFARRRENIAAKLSGRAVTADATLQSILKRRSRGAMLGHLLWQNYRQSIWPIVGLTLAAAVLVRQTGKQFDWRWGTPAGEIAAWIVIAVTALFGCFVFQADQSRHRYRFFIEHNVGPRYVWLSRQLPWLAGLIIATFAIVAIRVGIDNVRGILAMIANHDATGPPDFGRFDVGLLAEVGMLITFAAICYSAGQWASMMIRSAVIAVVVGAAMAIVLCGWTLLARAMGLDPLLTIVPIPLVLLFATWLRAPDWIAENRRWSARLTAAAVLVVPAVAILIGARFNRVYQIPLVGPGFDVAPTLREMEVPSPAAEALRRAVGNFDSEGKQPEEKWLAQNAKTLALLADAVRQPGNAFQNSLEAEDPTPYGASEMFNLAIQNAAQLQRQGKLDAAADQYFVALELACKADIIDQPFSSYRFVGDAVFQPLVQWGAEKGQTTARIKSAIARLKALGPETLPLEARMEWFYLYARHKLQHGDGPLWTDDASGGRKDEIATDIRWSKFMPWERQRAERMLNLLTSISLERLERIRQWMADGTQVVGFLLTEHWSSPDEDVRSYFPFDYNVSYEKQTQEVEWLRTTHPTDLKQIGEIGVRAASTLVRYEAWRRSTMILLALEAYRLDHGTLPKSLGALAPAYLERVAGQPPSRAFIVGQDPYSGEPFYYFPTGMPPGNLSNAADSEDPWYIAHISPGTPGIWCTGPDIDIEGYVVDGSVKVGPQFRVFNAFRWSSATVWQRGLWFPIPEQKH
jgi:hypothetical protein